MIAIIAIVVITWFVYKTARENGKNGFLWAFLTVVAFLGTQVLIGVAYGLFLAFGIVFWGWDDNVLDQSPNLILSLATTALSFIPVYFIYRHVNRIPDESYDLPPAPPKFND